MKSAPPRVSVVVTTRNEELVLTNLLESVRTQTYPDLETVVVDNDSTDRTKAIARRYTPLVFNYGPERSSQRNYGAKQATGDYLLFLDADMELSSTVVAECVALLAKRSSFQSEGIAIGAAIVPEVSYGEGYWSSVKAFERSFYVGDDAVESARFYDRNVFEAAGGFDESLIGPEDWDLSERVRERCTIGHIGSFIRHNEKRLTLLGLARKSCYYARDAKNLLEKRGLSPLSGRTIYFLRPAFYRQWRRLVRHPLLSASMLVMLTVQLFAGAASFARSSGGGIVGVRGSVR